MKNLTTFQISSTAARRQASGRFLDEKRKVARLGHAERRLLPASHQRDRLVGRGSVAGIHPVDRGRGGISNPQERSADPPRVASETGPRAGPHPGLLPGLRILDTAKNRGFCRRRLQSPIPRKVSSRLDIRENRRLQSPPAEHACFTRVRYIVENPTSNGQGGRPGHEPRRIFEELGKISLVDVVLPTRNGPEIRHRCVRRPTDHQAIPLERLGLVLPRQITS